MKTITFRSIFWSIVLWVAFAGLIGSLAVLFSTLVGCDGSDASAFQPCVPAYQERTICPGSVYTPMPPKQMDAGVDGGSK